MALAASLLPELEQEAKATRRLLERVPQDSLSWKPHEKSFSLGELAWHIALTPAQIVAAATPDVYEVDEFTQPPVPAQTPEILMQFDDSVKRAAEYLARLDDAAATATWRLKIKGREVMAMPRIAFMRSLLFNHLYHHRGQLTVYLRLLDVPVPGLYGPSADEEALAG